MRSIVNMIKKPLPASSQIYSVLKFLTGFCAAALYVCEIIVANPITNKTTKHATALGTPKFTLSEKFCRNRNPAT